MDQWIMGNFSNHQYHENYWMVHNMTFLELTRIDNVNIIEWAFIWSIILINWYQPRPFKIIQDQPWPAKINYDIPRSAHINLTNQSKPRSTKDAFWYFCHLFSYSPHINPNLLPCHGLNLSALVLFVFLSTT